MNLTGFGQSHRPYSTIIHDQHAKYKLLSGLYMTKKKVYPISSRFIPLDSGYEGAVEEKLWQEKRAFIKPLRYDGEEDVFPDFVLKDVADISFNSVRLYNAIARGEDKIW